MNNSRPLPLGSTIQFPNRCRWLGPLQLPVKQDKLSYHHRAGAGAPAPLLPDLILAYLNGHLWTVAGPAQRATENRSRTASEKADQENRVRDTTARPRCYRLGPLSRRTTTNDSLSVGRMVRLVGLVMTLRSTIVTIVYLYSQ